MQFNLSNIRIVGKIVSAFIILLCCTVGLGLFSISRLSAVSSDATDLRDNWMPATRYVGDMARAAERLRVAQANGLLATNEEQATNRANVRQGALDLFKKAWSQYEPTITPPNETPLAEAVRLGWANYMTATEKFQTLLGAGQKAEATAFFLGDMSERMKALRSALDADAEFQAIEGKKAGDDGAQTASSAFTWIIIALIGTALSCLMLGFALIRGISTPITAITAAMGRLANKDLSIDIPGVARRDEVGKMAKAVEVFKQNALNLAASEAEQKRLSGLTEEERRQVEAQRIKAAKEQAQVVQSLAQGLEHLSNGNLVFRLDEAFAAEYEQLRKDFNGAMEKLQDTMKTVSASASAIRSGTGEISHASDDLSRRTEQQAASLEETAAALDEITATVRKTAEGSKHAREVVGQAKHAAEHSGTVVRQAVEAMGGIERSANQIGNIIGVIDEIAFQTNLLALNAGVEAARAGDAGRGFAVVASEVRALAQRSAEAAKEIKTLISTSSQQVKQGVDLVDQTGKALDKIVVQVAEITTIVTDIAASAQEQATALNEVNTAVNQMDQVTQQNAAMVEETTAASHALSQETEELSRLISSFDVGQDKVAARSEKQLTRADVRPRAKSSTVTALKTTGHGGAARKQEAAANDWQEF